MKTLKIHFDKTRFEWVIDGVQFQKEIILEKPAKIEFKREGNNGYAYISLYDWQ